MMENGWSWWWMIPLMMCMVLLIGAVVWGVLAVTASTTGTPPKSSEPTPENILNERFARGEIGPTEYRERMDALHTRPMAKT